MKANMMVRVRTLLGLGSAALIAAALVPTAAAAAAPPLAALSGGSVPGKPGELASPVLGVANLSGAVVPTGFAVNIRVIEGLNLPRTFSNCQYYEDHNLEGAWCDFNQELAVDGKYALVDFQVAVLPDAVEADSVIFRWATPDEVKEHGGIEALAKRDSFTDTAAAGTGGTLRLEPRELALPEQPNPTGFAGISVTVPSPTPTPTPTPTASTSTAPTAPPVDVSAEPSAAPTSSADGGEGGGLPVTGPPIAIVTGTGLLLLIAGGAFYLLARRRAKFES